MWHRAPYLSCWARLGLVALLVGDRLRPSHALGAVVALLGLALLVAGFGWALAAGTVG